MKTLLFLLFAAFAPLAVLCQVVFPEEPQWRMPIFFEDGRGQRDTVWLGADPDAHDYLSEIDTQFGEMPYWPPSPQDSSFRVYWAPQLSVASKVNIMSMDWIGLNGYLPSRHYLKLENLQVPLKVWINLADLFDPRVPFPLFIPGDTTLPRFSIVFTHNIETQVSAYDPLGVVNNLYNLADTMSWVVEWDPIGSFRSELYLTHFEVHPYGYLSLDRADGTGDQVVFAVKRNRVEIQNVGRDFLELEVRSVGGQLLYRRSSREAEQSLDLDGLPSGLYVVLARHAKGVKFVKVLVP